MGSPWNSAKRNTLTFEQGSGGLGPGPLISGACRWLRGTDPDRDSLGVGRVCQRTSVALLKKGEWKQSGSFGKDDLLLLAKLADLAHTWIYRRLQDDRREESF